MADQFLSVQESSLQTIADAIKNKCGISSSTKLEFPGDANKVNSFVGALKGIETEITVTPKISPQQKTLTLNDTSFAISPGFHDGTGTVKINTQPKTVTPSSSQQTVTPDANYFLSSVLVKGIGSGKQVATGTFTATSNSVTISGFGSFKPAGIAGYIINHSNVGKDRVAVFQGFILGSSSYYMSTLLYGNKANFRSGRTANEDNITYANGSVSINFGAPYQPAYGTYFYVVWGS